MYKTKEEAINTIKENDRNEEFYDYELFKSKEFDLFRDNKEVVLTAVQNSSYAIKYTSDRLRDDKEVALVAVKKNGLAIQHCSERLRDDNDVVLLALKKSGFGEAPLKYASERIKKICNGMNQNESIEALTKAIETEKLHEQLQREIKPKGLDIAKSLSAECKQSALEQSNQVAKPKARMKI